MLRDTDRTKVTFRLARCERRNFTETIGGTQQRSRQRLRMRGSRAAGGAGAGRSGRGKAMAQTFAFARALGPPAPKLCDAISSYSCFVHPGWVASGSPRCRMRTTQNQTLGIEILKI